MDQEREPDVGTGAGGSIDQFRQLVALIADGVVVVDANGKTALVNAAAEDLLGKTGRDLLGRELNLPLTSSEISEFEIARPDGSTVIVEARAAETHWDGAPAVVISLRDVTARALYAEQQEELIRRLQELDELKTDFVSMVSHDLRAPMAAISGFADTLRKGWGSLDDVQRKRMLQRISEKTKQLAHLVENVLQVGQIEAGGLSYDLKEVDLRVLVQRVVAENSDELAGDRRDIRIDIPDGLPPIHADELRQWQILTNLLTNAIKFSPATEPIEVAVTLDGGRAIVVVKDRGNGIRDEDRDKLFQKFSRLDQPDDLNFKGSGLGLYICKAMVEAQGGEIWVDTAPGAGATFAYSVPLAG